MDFDRNDIRVLAKYVEDGGKIEHIDGSVFSSVEIENLLFSLRLIKGTEMYYGKLDATTRNKVDSAINMIMLSELLKVFA